MREGFWVNMLPIVIGGGGGGCAGRVFRWVRPRKRSRSLLRWSVAVKIVGVVLGAQAELCRSGAFCAGRSVTREVWWCFRKEIAGSEIKCGFGQLKYCERLPNDSSLTNISDVERVGAD